MTRNEIDMALETIGRGRVEDACCEIDGVRFTGRLCGRLFLGERARADADAERLELAGEATWQEVALPPLVPDRPAIERCATCRGGGMVSCECATCDHTHDAVCADCDGTGPFLAHAINARLIGSAVGWARPERVHLAGARVVIRDLRAGRVAIVTAYAVML